MGTFTNNEDPDEMLHYAAFHQGLHCLLRKIQFIGTEVQNYLEISAYGPLSCHITDRIQRVKEYPEKIKEPLKTVRSCTHKVPKVNVNPSPAEPGFILFR